mgnify:CR=1 FL=1
MCIHQNCQDPRFVSTVLLPEHVANSAARNSSVSVDVGTESAHNLRHVWAFTWVLCPAILNQGTNNRVALAFVGCQLGSTRYTQDQTTTHTYKRNRHAHTIYNRSSSKTVVLASPRRTSRHGFPHRHSCCRKAGGWSRCRLCSNTTSHENAPKLNTSVAALKGFSPGFLAKHSGASHCDNVPQQVRE